MAHRGGGKGRDGSKKQEAGHIDRDKCKAEQFEERKSQMDSLLGCMNEMNVVMNKKMKGSILRKAFLVADKQEDKEEIKNKLLGLALEL